MNEKRILNIKGAMLDKYQLEKYLEKIASDHILKNRSDKNTYPITRLNENYQFIKSVYNLLNEHIKMKIPIHPAGEWILDNIYIVEETVKNISKDLSLKKYSNFVSIADGKYKGFARVYVLASEMIAYTDGIIDNKNLENMLQSYQNKKALGMEEIWNIGIFLQIALVENIRQICEKIYYSQMQKYKVEYILNNTIEKKSKTGIKENFYFNKPRITLNKSNQIKYTFIEYMSYRLKKYGKTAYPYLKILENEVEKAGTTVTDIIKKEHFDIAVKKVAMGNSIMSLKEISRMNFLEIFEKINGVEDILREDPACQYEKMDAVSKSEYRNTIEEISKKTKLSEIYIARKCLELSKKANDEPKNHIGYYLISKGKMELLHELTGKENNGLADTQKAKLYIGTIWSIATVITTILCVIFFKQISAINILGKYTNTPSNISIYYRIILSALLYVIIILPIVNSVTKVIQYILSKCVKPKPIPKLNFLDGIPKEYATMVVIPTILKSKEQIKTLFEKLEVYYIANKSENIFFTLLGDCSSSSKIIEEYDDEVINEGLEQVKRLNKKYNNTKFNFIYRKRVWNDKEECYLGWERKRGLLDQFNEYILGKIENPFRISTLEEEDNKVEKIKYIITLDSDTDLTINSGLELIGAMAHILNKPILNKTKDAVVTGHGIIAPRVGIGLEESRKSIFTMLYSGQGGTDSYSNAISDLYQDNFDEGIYAGKGIYDLEIFSEVLNKEIKENTVLSHDLLEGSYLRSAFASDIMLMDGYPSNYIAERKRLYRWIRGDWQITLWLRNKIETKNGSKKKNPLNLLSKYKIISNIFRSKQEEKILELIIFFIILKLSIGLNICKWLLLTFGLAAITTIIDLVNAIISKKSDCLKTKSFTKQIPKLAASFYRLLISISNLPDRAYMTIKAEIVSLHRMIQTKKHLLEWETSEEAERNSKQSIVNYYKTMEANGVMGIVGSMTSIIFVNSGINVFLICLSIAWLISPFIMYVISKKNQEIKAIDILDNKQKEFLQDVAYKTWLYFKDTLNERNNYLPPDNYQEDRKPKLVTRTSSTNIGLGLLAVISSYDMKYETLENTINLLDKIINTILNLPKWNGHLYNWYDIEKMDPLIPKFISSVDSGNFIGYLYVTKQFLEEAIEKIKNANDNKIKLNKIDRRITEERDLGDKQTIEKISLMITNISKIIDDTDFSRLYDKKTRLFSVGFNVEENNLVDSYYDLLASEARQTSLVAIAKKDVSPKHWNNLSRTLTSLNGYNGLISWSGTAFEYLMPNINIPNYKGSMLDESCRFMIMSQIDYANKLGVPWGFSEAAFNMKDLYGNYQYKAFGIPWLGLKRGLADEIVVSSYGTILAILQAPEEVMKNIDVLKDNGAIGKYGFYESVDYTPSRVKEKYEIVKTYMAHHQGLILLSINNLFNNKILQKRFMKNPEMQSIKLLLEERKPENMLITKEEKEKVEKIKYLDYEDYNQRVYTKIQENLNISNVISNDKYTVVMDQYGNGYSNYKDIQVNRFKITDDETQGILFFIKDIKNKRIWTNTYSKYLSKPDKYAIAFCPDMNKISRVDGSIKTVTKVIIANDEPVEIRRIELSNTGNMTQILELTSYIEPILSDRMQDYAHKAFNNLFLTYEYIDNIDTILVKRKNRDPEGQSIFMAIKLFSENENIDTEYEINKEKFFGRDNINLPVSVENSIPLSKKIENVVDPIVALRKIININPEETKKVSLIISVGSSKEEVLNKIIQFSSSEALERVFELSRARVEAETRYLGLKGKDIETYQRMLSYLIYPYKFYNEKIEKNKIYPIEELWKYGISGDLPILLVKISNINDIDTVKEAINAYEYYKTKNIKIDLVILNEEKENYEGFVKEAIITAVLNKNLGYVFNTKGGIYLLNNINEETDKKLIAQKARFIINASDGNLNEQIKDLESKIKEDTKQIGYDARNEYIYINENQENKLGDIFNEQDLKYFNEYGGFNKNADEYIIRVNKYHKLPSTWSHIMANERFGTLVTESLGGYTWQDNSRLNRITAWSNNRVADVPSEIIYFKDMKSGKKWSMGFNPMPDENDYYAIYGFGYARFSHNSDEIDQDLTIFIPKEDNVKVNLLRLTNRRAESRNIKLVYYLKPVLGEDEINSNGNISLEFNKNSNMIILKNMSEKNNIMYVSSSEKIESYTGNKSSFLYNSNITNPSGLDQLELDRDNSYKKDGILAIEMNIKIEAMSEKELTIVIGGNNQNMHDIAYKYSNILNCQEELRTVKKYWKDLINRMQVQTPSESMNIILNGWLIYQTIVSRIIARTGFYQSGGAYGFRDQLQDSMSVKYFDPIITRNQIIKHSSHQFIEGDVEHWWHDETTRGIRTRFSDDLLWLPYVTADYIDYTKDYGILNEETNYLEGEVLKDGENEKYDMHNKSKNKGSIYEHCIKAIEKSLKFGENDLPLIGSGDWNDGFSNIGVQGKGESVWLGFFLYDVLKHFIPICEYMEDKETANRYVSIMEKIKRALNTKAWDGRWFRRAFMDSGEILGSLNNEECRIDGISQSWSVISEAGENDKKFIAMESLENHLIDKTNGIIKLLDPPFDKSKIEPGYIKAYIPGTRENGGQYTHE